MNYNEMWKPLLRMCLIHHKAHHKENNPEQTQTFKLLDNCLSFKLLDP